MGEITFIYGDATNPIGEGTKIIVHICNDIGRWGKGFVLAISRKWSAPETAFRKWYADNDGFKLGAVQFVQVEEDLWVANLIGQRDIKRRGNSDTPIRYAAVRSGLEHVAQRAKELEASVHMPRIGCGLAGGKWEEIEAIIRDTLLGEKIETIVYDFK